MGYVILVDDRTITVNEATVFSDSILHTYEFLGADRVLGTYRLSLNGERIEDLPNLDSKVQKAEIATHLEQEAKYESGELVRLTLQWNGEEFFDVDTGLAVKLDFNK
ncbi:hypothetical protein D3C76_1550380 [compost metagenome]